MSTFDETVSKLILLHRQEVSGQLYLSESLHLQSDSSMVSSRENQDLREHLGSLKQQLTHSNTKIVLLEQTISTLNNDKDEQVILLLMRPSHVQLDIVETRLKEALAQNSTLNKDFNSLKEEHKMLITSHNHLKSEMDELKQEYEKLAWKYSKSKQEYARKKEKWLEFSKNYASRPKQPVSKQTSIDCFLGNFC